MSDSKNTADQSQPASQAGPATSASAAADSAYVQLAHINKAFGSFQASSDISFSIKKGGLVALLGPSGSGKTTILRMIAGLETPDSGEIRIDDQVVNDVPAAKRKIGFVFQNYALFRYMTVFDNIAFGLRVEKRPADEVRRRVSELIELVGLAGMEKRYPNQLSGGQRQRVAFARALAPEPHLLLLDEPFAAIDAKVRLELRTWLRQMINRVGITSIFVTHDQNEAIEVADQIIVTNHGRVEQIGTPEEIYREPATPFAAEFIGQTERLDASKLEGFTLPAGTTEAIARPEFVQITKAGEASVFEASSLPARVVDVKFRGNAIEVSVERAGNVFVGTRSLDATPLAVGEEARLFVRRVFACTEGAAQLVENDALRTDTSLVI